MELKELFKAISTNGRWGLAVVGKEGITFPAKGKLIHLGEVEGISTYKFEEDEQGVWILPCAAKMKPVAGATVVEAMGLQSGRAATIVAGGDFFAVEKFGYKDRDSEILAFSEGQELELPATVMVAMGLLPAQKKEKVNVEIPPINNALAEAFKKAKGAEK